MASSTRATPSWLMLALLTAVNAMNYADRTLLAVLAQPIKTDLGLSDTQVGLASGAAFALTFSLAGLLLARWADRFSHKWVLCGAIVVWSTMCLVTSVVRDFVQLFALRLGLGVGESGAAPSAYALIQRVFDQRRQPLAYGLFLAGATIGIGGGVALGGHLGATLGWRTTMAVMALPGFVLALLIAMLVGNGPPLPAMREALPTTASVFRQIATDPLRRLLVAIQASTAVAYAGFAQWMPTFYMRVHGMTLQDVGASYSITSSLGALAGLIVGGALVGRVMAVSETRALRACGVLNVAAAFASLLAFFAPDVTVSLFAFACFGAFTGSTYAPTVSLFQRYSDPRTQALAAAAMMLVVINVGQGGGPVLIGALSDLLSGGSVAHPLVFAMAAGSAALFAAALLYLLAARQTAGAIAAWNAEPKVGRLTA